MNRHASADNGQQRPGIVLVSYQREVLVQPGSLSHPQQAREPLAVALPRALYRRLGRIVAGDEVLYEPDRRGGRPSVVELLPRRSEFSRTTPDGRSQLLFANLEQLVICVSPFDPPFRQGLIDRLLIAADVQDLQCLLLLNKSELADAAFTEELLEPYRALGLPCLKVSAVTGEGIPQLEAALSSRCSAFVGHSGVGKSSLVNRLVPGAELPVGCITEATGKGQHTTTRSRLLPLPGSGFLLDSPGIRMFALADLEPLQVARLFPDFAGLDPCRFSNCLHLVEDGCSILLAVEKDRVAPERYESYLRLVHGLDPSLVRIPDFEEDPFELEADHDEELD